MTQATPLPPTMRGGPVLGLLADLRRDVLGTLECARREHGDVVGLVAGPPRLRSITYAVFHPDAVRRVLATEADRYRKDSRFYNEVRWALGDGLLNSQDDRWLRQRRFVQPLFTRRRIATYAAAMAEASEALVAGLSAAAGKWGADRVARRDDRFRGVCGLQHVDDWPEPVAERFEAAMDQVMTSL